MEAGTFSSDGYIITDEIGKQVIVTSYETALERACNDIGMAMTNNHALRKYYNSMILIPAGLTVTQRAKIMGHSVATNERHYSFAGQDAQQDALMRLTRSPQVTTNKIASFVRTA